ncbi:hypothetical protein LCGC14_0938250 [marine sediment metagenome]|uniref:ClpX-type ZB domain-containing protein n=1 Tax=marine sediment metagenome TaxID=412755 RepID=A0A0F9NQJ3_9ZZZZ
MDNCQWCGINKWEDKVEFFVDISIKHTEQICDSCQKKLIKVRDKLVKEIKKEFRQAEGERT